MNFENKKSTVKKYEYESADKLISDLKEYTYVIIYKLDGVEILNVKGEIQLNKENFLELRAFNENGELHVAYIDGQYMGRTRMDGTGEDVEVVDEHHLLWGNPQKHEGEYTYLSEDRGVELKLPIEIKGNERAFVTVRNYLNPDKNVFEFNDYRMVDFIAKEVEEYDEKE